jgi:nicotinamidase-related amidase
MPVDLPALLDPARAALLLRECQEGVIGDAARLGALADAVRRHGTVAAIARVLGAARRVRVPVFHCLMVRRSDGGGAAVNCRLLAAARKSAAPLLPGSPQQAPVAALAPVAGEWVVERHHGLTPFHGTELDPILRNLGVRTVVATGVSVNVGILGLVLEAVNAGHQVVLPREAVTGTPDHYVEAVLEHTLSLLATVTSVEQVETIWS